MFNRVRRGLPNPQRGLGSYTSSLSLHCFGPSQILFHGAKRALTGILQLRFSRRRFKPLSWHPQAGRGENRHMRRVPERLRAHTYYLLHPFASCSVRRTKSARHICSPLTHGVRRSNRPCKLIHSTAKPYRQTISEPTPKVNQ